MIVMDLQPISIVEDRGFNAFVKTLDPRYKIPSRKCLMEGTIADMYKDCQDKARANCQRAHSVVLTTDMWTSRSIEAYLTVSCHFIDNWQMQEFVLETDRLRMQPHGIKAVPEVVQLLEKCSSIVSFFHHSTKATKKLKQIQKQLKVAEHKLIQSVETRWNSVFYMLERLHEQREAVTTALCLLGKNTLCLSIEELFMIHLTIEALRPFKEATREVSAKKHVFVSKVIPLVSLLLRAAAAIERQGSSLAAELGLQCQSRFRGIETFHSLAADNVETMKKRMLTEMQEVHQPTSE
ncbi:ZBED4 protein, partial [Polyodon spathula]|nr:ZBED4 protein [Polyodon spathula]